MLRDFVVVVVRRSMPLAMLSTKKELHGFLFLCTWFCSYSNGVPPKLRFKRIAAETRNIRYLLLSNSQIANQKPFSTVLISCCFKSLTWYLYLMVPFWYASAAYQSSLAEPLFVFWRDAVESNYPWRDQTSLICRRSVPKRYDYWEPVPVIIENEMSIAKFRISSYFVHITSKVLMRFSFFEIEGSSKIAILAARRRRKWPKIGHFLFARTDQRDDVYQYTLGSS